MLVGNANDDGEKTRGWFVGHFVENSPLKTKDVEVKWGSHPKGEAKDGAGVNVTAKTLTILIDGKISLHVDGKEVILQDQGDYVYMEPGETHTWRALEDSVAITVRWPSVPNDQVVTAV